MKYFIYALLLIALALPQITGAQEPDADGDGIPDWGDPDNINVPAERELPTDYPIYPAEQGETAQVSNIRLVAFRSPNPEQAPLRIRYCPRLTPTCENSQANETLGWWSVDTAYYVDYGKCMYDPGVKYLWCLVVNEYGEAYLDPNPNDGYMAGYVAIADGNGRRVWMKSR